MAYRTAYRACLGTFSLKRACAGILLMFSLLAMVACGKKASPSLKAYERPEAPSNLVLSRREDSIALTWYFPRAKEASISQFVIMRMEKDNFHPIATVEKGMRSFIDRDFSEGVTYVYKIISRSPNGFLSNDSSIVQIMPLKQLPPPKNFTALAQDSHLHLYWEAVDRNARYNIYKSFTRGLYGPKPLNPEPLTSNAYKDSLSLSKPVYYVIRSLMHGEVRDEGPQSEEIAVDPVTFVPSAPRDLRCFLSPESVFLQWKEPEESWITLYRVYRRIGDDRYILIGDTQVPSYLDRDAPAVRRDYRVTAVGPLQEGPAIEILGVKYETY